MDWNQVCDCWDAEWPTKQTVFSASYDEGVISVRPTEGDFEYRLAGCRSQADRDWRPSDRWYSLAAANGDFVGMKYYPEYYPA